MIDPNPPAIVRPAIDSLQQLAAELRAGLEAVERADHEFELSARKRLAFRYKVGHCSSRLKPRLLMGSLKHGAKRTYR